MSKFFLISRIVILVALMILIISCFWGWFNQTHAQPIPEMSQLEKYSSKKPGPITTTFFVVSIFLGRSSSALPSGWSTSECRTWRSRR